MNLGLLDPELRTVFERMPALDIWDDLPAVRVAAGEMLKQMYAQFPKIESVATTDHVVPGLNGAPGVAVRVYRPENRTDTLPGLFWIHGGGYVLGSMEMDDMSCRLMISQVPCVIVSVEYRLAPEHPFPLPMDDCYAGLKWMWDNAAQLGVDRSRIGLHGLSAGGGLAAGLALLARDRGEVDLMFQMLLCPMIDDRNTTPSSYLVTDNRTWSRASNIRGWAAYLGDAAGSGEVSPYAAAARAGNLSGLPPAYIAVGGMDLFRDENIEYARRLCLAGVPVELHLYPGGFHGFEYAAPDAQISRRARDMHRRALRQAFGLDGT